MSEELKDESSPLTYLPSDVIQSGTVQALISQNEDLMARLNSQLRRSASLEAKAQKLAESQDLLIRQNDQLQDQLAIASEKCKSYEGSFLKITEQRDEIQATFAELYTRARETEQQLRGQIENYHQRLLRYQKYRKAISTRVRPFIDRIKATAADFKKRLDQSEAHSISLQTELSENKSLVRQMQSRLNIQVEQSQKDLTRLTDHYESQVSALRDESVRLQEENQRVLRKNAELLAHSSALTENLVILENKKIWADRQKTAVESESSEKIETLLQDLKSTKTELRRLEIDVVELGQIKEKLLQTNAKLEEKLQALEEEVLDKNALLDQSLTTIAEMKTRAEGAQRLNLDLNQSLRAAREDLERVYREKLRLEAQTSLPNFLESRQVVAPLPDTPRPAPQPEQAPTAAEAPKGPSLFENSESRRIEDLI